MPERHLSRARGDELLGILIPSAAQLMVRKFRINNYELSHKEKNATCPAKAIYKKEITYEIKRANTSGWSHGLHFAVAFGHTDSRVIYYLLTSRLFLTKHCLDLTELRH